MPKLLIDVEAKYAQFQDSLVQIERQSTDTVGKISQAFGGLNTILAGVGVSLGAAAFVAGLKQITDSIDALNDASDATGASVENLSALEAVARRNGETLDTVTTAAVKLNQALNEDAGGDKAKILQAIGLSAQELRQQDPAQAVKTVADALAQYEDGGNKARIILELFGKSARELAPFLKDLAESGQLNATVTKQQAEEAERFNKLLFGMSEQFTQVGRAIASDVLPPMLALFSSVSDNTSGANAMKSGFDALATVFETVAVLGVNVAYVLTQIVEEINGLAVQAVAIAHLDFDSAKSFGLQMKANAAAARVEVDRLSESILNARKRAADPIEAGNAQKAPDVTALLAKPKAIPKDKSDKLRDSAQKMIDEWSPLELQWNLKAEDFEGGANADIKKWQAESQEKLDQLVAKYKDLADPVEKYRKEIELITALEKTGNLSPEEASAARLRVWEQQARAVDEVNGKVTKQKGLVEELGLTFSSAAEDAIVNFKSLGDVINSIGRDILKYFVRQSITKPLLESLGNSNLISDSISFFSGKAVFAANGHAFGPSGLIPFANGGVVDSPTPFKFSQGAGVMGEDGPEAILPLKRGAGGKLGVAADGVSGGGVSVTIINNAPAQVSTRQTSDGGLEVLIDAVDAALGDRVSAGIGAISGAMQGRYGLRPSMGI